MVVEDSTGTERLMAFRVGRGRFAVHLDGVVGVQDPVVIASGERAAVQFRGRPVPAVDARGLGWGKADAPRADAPSAAIIVAGGGAGPMALIVDRVEGIVAGAAMRPLPGLVAPFVRGIFRGVALDAEGGRLVVDPAALVAMAAKTAAVGGRGRPGES